MSRVKRGVMVRKRHKKILKLAKGYYGAHSKQFKQAKEAVQHALKYAYRDRRARKRQFRRLWIARINAACRQLGVTYNQFIHGLQSKGIQVDRKVMADLAINDPGAFQKLVEQACATS